MPTSDVREATFCFVDLAGFTALTETHGDRAAADTALARFEVRCHKNPMGLVYVDMNVSARGKAARAVRFLVDSGAAYSVLPQKVWKALKLKPKRTLEFTLADGTTITRNVSECRFEFGGIDAASPVILGEERDEALLGVVTLENLGLVLNPFERTLSPMRMMLAALRL